MQRASADRHMRRTVGAIVRRVHLARRAHLAIIARLSVLTHLRRERHVVVRMVKWVNTTCLRGQVGGRCSWEAALW